VSVQNVVQAANRYGTPLYFYDEYVIQNNCHEILAMPNAFGMQVRYAMKANANMSLLELITEYGLDYDISSLHEGRRAALAGIPCSQMMLTSQDVPMGEHRRELEKMMRAGLVYTVCSLRQLELVANSAVRMETPLAIRVHPGFGSGESATRNTGDRYSCFGIHECDIPTALRIAKAA
jgi:diaminopimelate decarboxylase